MNEEQTGTGKAADAETKRMMQEFRGRGDGTRAYTLEELSRLFGSNPAQLSKYLSTKPGVSPVGDVARLESVARDVMRAAARRAERQEQEVWETPVTEQVRIVCETIRKTGDVGLIHGPAGIGKTCALARYVAANPSVILVTAYRWACGPTEICRSIFNSMDTRKYSGNVARVEWVLERLRRSERLLIVDNAHRLNPNGLAWLFDFHDETGCPLALTGNPEVLDAIRRNDQQFSRIGLNREVTLGRKERLQANLAAIAERMCARHLNDKGEDIADLCIRVLGERGHLRALDKHLRLVVEMLPHKGDLRETFLAAHNQVVSDYRLG
jgi:DNA transposition AAA+ family ATPase